MEYISRSQVRYDWINNMFEEYLSLCKSEDEKLQLICWYFSYGKELGVREDDLKNTIRKLCNYLYDKLDFQWKHFGQTPPDYRIGDYVEVIINAKNITYHKGKIIKHIWHGNERCWNFYISEEGKKISKRFT